MALEDLAMFRAIPTCTVFYPSDAVSTERAVELAANPKVGAVTPPPPLPSPLATGPHFLCVCGHSSPGSHVSTRFCSQGICFIRTSRPETKVLYGPDEKFEVGLAKVRGTLSTGCFLLGKRGCWCFKSDLGANGSTQRHRLRLSVSKVVRQSDNDQVTVIGAGVTLHEALEAADILAKEGKCPLPSSGSRQTLQLSSAHSSPGPAIFASFMQV